MLLQAVAVRAAVVARAGVAEGEDAFHAQAGLLRVVVEDVFLGPVDLPVAGVGAFHARADLLAEGAETDLVDLAVE